MKELPSRADFAGCLEGTFVIQTSAERAEEVQLVEVKVLPGAGPREQFSLVFRGKPGEDYLQQRTYSMVHEKLGAMALFLVPIGPDDRGMLYQAVFT